MGRRKKETNTRSVSCRVPLDLHKKLISLNSNYLQKSIFDFAVSECGADVVSALCGDFTPYIDYISGE